MNNRKMTYGLIGLYIAVVLFAGCIPEESLEWSADGSVGLLQTKESLYIVDGNNGGLTEIARGKILPWPGISKDGNLIVYSKEVNCPNLAEGLKLLPIGEVKMIDRYAGQMKERLLIDTSTAEKFLSDKNFLDKEPFIDENFKGFNEEYRNWVIRYMCEKADKKLVERLGDAVIAMAGAKEIKYSKLVVVPRNDPNNQKVVAVSVSQIWKSCFSPNGKYITYLVAGLKDTHNRSMVKFDLYVASLPQNIKAMHLASNVAFGYDWRSDSRAVVYMQAEQGDYDNDKFVPGTVKETTIVDANDNLLSEAIGTDKQDSVAACRCTGCTDGFAGVVFYWWMKVQYGQSGRILFSSAVMKFPSSKIDEERASLFYYDTTAGTVAEVLPAGIARDSDNLHLFSLSADGRRVLLPMDKNRFALYGFGESSANVLVPENECFGDNPPKIAPAWKGRDEVSCLVSEKSHFLTGGGQKEHNRKEIVILNAKGEFKRILSEKWPDEIMKNFE